MGKAGAQRPTKGWQPRREFARASQKEKAEREAKAQRKEKEQELGKTRAAEEVENDYTALQEG